MYWPQSFYGPGKMKNHTIQRLDKESALRSDLLRHCRLGPGEVWEDRVSGHRVGCLDAAAPKDIQTLMAGQRSALAIQDPPYNLVAFERRSVDEFIDWCRAWVAVTAQSMQNDSSLYVWLGADQDHGFQPLPEFMLMMRDFDFKSRSLITMRNQRGYGTQRNWMAVRQECLYYTRGKPFFQVQYTEIPKILRGYYKKINGRKTENLQRSKSENIRPGNVWVDIQQVFYRRQENVNGCYAQKPLQAIERIVLSSSQQDDIVTDFFGHSGSTLLACAKHKRKCFTCDLDPIYVEIMIRRLERYYESGTDGWQNSNPFETELADDMEHQQSIF